MRNRSPKSVKHPVSQVDRLRDSRAPIIEPHGWSATIGVSIMPTADEQTSRPPVRGIVWGMVS
jgi:hypothetical protein